MGDEGARGLSAELPGGRAGRPFRDVPPVERRRLGSGTLAAVLQHLYLDIPLKHTQRNCMGLKTTPCRCS